ncbi:PD40 domain-containing protein [Haliangium sp. UPWRP_2]|uniref:TolB family protein n=1 Tax=Haliangium sp. UPWRP_2 TaxID=1931276 RepID=UPI000B54431E|nr:PD40 domain-containing protein [Haliangium sp. UPWRP_2]PSM31569.1 hypothetical protein BVG81_004725 [Haliangium sp. UPWRP_2]
MPTPPKSPLDNSSCVGCHAISRDGRYMVSRLGGDINVAAIFDLTNDLSTNPPPVQYPVTNTLQRTFFASWRPDNKRIIVNETNNLRLLDTATGAAVTPTQGTLPASAATQPYWSPDGNSIAFFSEANNRGDALSVGNLSILPVTGPDAFGTVRRVHTASSIAGSTEDSYPSWSPDSKRIAFQNGTDARSNNQAGGALYLIHPPAARRFVWPKRRAATPAPRPSTSPTSRRLTSAATTG